MKRSSCDMSNFMSMIDALSEKERVKALKSALRKAGNKVKERAISNLRKEVHSSRKLEKGIKVKVWKKTAGFRVTVGEGFYKSTRFTGGKTQIIINREVYDREVPVLMWLETGTKQRSMRRGSKYAKYFRHKQNTGKLREYGYMARAQEQMSGEVTSHLQDSIEIVITGIAKKHGCK